MLLQQILFGIAAAWNPKAAQWTKGRQNWRKQLRKRLQPGKKRIWLHVASLGEFEQATPLIERLRIAYPSFELVLTFFSPSGYEVRKNDERATHVFYLPSDLPHNARDFIELVNPSLAIFIKYEFWYNYLHVLHARKMPVILVSAAFMPEHVFFQWWGGFFRSMLTFYNTIFVQDAYNRQLLVDIGMEDQVLVAGDTRYDRVVSIASSVISLPEVERFRQDHFLLVAGSTWPEDERLLNELLPLLPPQWKFILAPHEVHAAHINELAKLFEGDCILYSSIEQASANADKRVLIIDNIGMLSRLYAYGDIAYVGGGFRKRGLHNILEPAAFGLPVLIGPAYNNFVEAIRFVEEKYAYAVTSSQQAEERIRVLVSDAVQWNECRGAIRTFMQQHTGAAEKVIQHIETKGWLRQ